MMIRLLFFVLHALMGWVALRTAFLLRFYFDPLPLEYGNILMRTLPWAVLLKAVAADLTGLTRYIWRYASFRDLQVIVLASVAGSLFFAVPAFQIAHRRFPNGVFLLDFLLTLFAFTCLRFSGRLWHEGWLRWRHFRKSTPCRVLVLGGGDKGELALRFLRQSILPPVRVVGLLEDHPRLVGRKLLGCPVLGTTPQLENFLRELRVDEVLIALPAPGPERIREIFLKSAAVGCRVRLLPEAARLSDETPHLPPIRELQLRDFLGRDPVMLDPAPLRDSLSGLRVLVTGAGGSIGSELCRQIARLPVRELQLLDHSENALFEISEELRAAAPELKLQVLLCDIRFGEEVRGCFLRHRPDLVFHAAACKHVPMMEAHPLEAARTNVLGTRNVVESARASGVRRLLHVSTDKVVRAEGVMGASKAWGEWLVRHAAATRGLSYVCVRFGNVLGSNGSVIPLFEKQWQREGRLQVTHGEATRFFMTIEEAVLLMLHAEALRGSGEVYILDMGEPVSILELAEQMARLKNPAVPPGELIRIVGLRPGERVHERLHGEEERLTETRVPKVRRVEGSPPVPDPAPALRELEALVAAGDSAGVAARLRRGNGA